MKKKILLYLTEEEYKKFRIQSIMMGKSASERIDKFIKQQVKGEK